MLASKRTIKIAVVGSGLAGLTAAYRLTMTKSLDKTVDLEVHLFEKSDELGMDAHSIDIPIVTRGQKGSLRVDVPMRSFLEGYYPHLIRLYKYLGVEFKRADHSYSFSNVSFEHGKRKIETSILYNGNSGLAGMSVPSNLRRAGGYTTNCFAWLTFVVSTVLLCVNYIRVIFLACPSLQGCDVTFGEWIENNCPRNLLARLTGFDSSWRHLCYDILLPLFSGICTASRAEVLSHPVLDFLDCIWAGLFGHHYVAANNVQDVVRRLSQSIPYIHTNCAIAYMSPDYEDDCRVTLATNRVGQTFSGFSHVIFACQAPAIPSILSSYVAKLSPSSTQRLQVEDVIRCMQTFKYRTTVTVNHTDESFLPDDEQDYRDINLVDSILDTPWPLERDGLCRDHTCTMATHIIPCSTTTTRIYQTTNPLFRPRQERILSVTYLERVVVTADSKRALQNLSCEERTRKWWQGQSKGKSHLGRLQGCGRLGPQSECLPGIWFCGSYASGGIPLLEGCVVSAKNVVDQGILAGEGVRHVEFTW